YDLDFGSANGVVVLEAQGRTRMVVNLNRPAPYSTRVQGNTLFATIGEDAAVAAPAGLAAAAAQAAPGAAQAGVSGDIRGVNFRRGEGGAGEVLIDLARAGLSGGVERVGSTLRLRFAGASLDSRLQQRLDVGDFATPVRFVNVYQENGNVMVVAEVEGGYDYIAYQSGSQYVLSVTPLTAAQQAAAGFQYSGERISLDFQDINVRAVLQILADFNDFSLVVSDSVSGNITLR